MSTPRRLSSLPLVFLAAALVAACGTDKADTQLPAENGVDDVSELTLTEASANALRTCISDTAMILSACMEADGALCDAEDEGFAQSLAALGGAIRAHGGDEGLFGLSMDATVARLQAACRSES